MGTTKSKTTIRKKLFFNFMVIVALLIILGLVGLYEIHEIYQNSREIYMDNMTSVNTLRAINQNIKEMDQCVISMMSSLDADFHTDYVQTIHNLQDDNTALMNKYLQLNLTNEERASFTECQSSILSFNKAVHNIVTQIESKDTSGATANYEQIIIPAKTEVYELLDSVVDLATANAEGKNNQNHKIFITMNLLIMGILVLSIIISIVISIRLNNYFTSRLYTIRKLAKRISEYNVSDDITDITNDEFGETIAALNDSQMMVRDLLEKIINESVTINDTGEEVSLAIRKSAHRIETANVKVYNAESGCIDIQGLIMQILDNRNLNDETILHLRELLATVSENQSLLKSTQTELTGIATYLEQIGITMDYQNEIAGEHRDQIQKFKV